MRDSAFVLLLPERPVLRALLLKPVVQYRAQWNATGYIYAEQGKETRRSISDDGEPAIRW